MFRNRFFRPLEGFFHDMFLDRASAPRHAVAVNIWQGENGLLLTARLPGVKAEELNIHALGRTLTLSAKRGEDTLFTRSFTLPVGEGGKIDAGAITATLEDGVLRLELPVAKEAKPRRIEIKCA